MLARLVESKMDGTGWRLLRRAVDELIDVALPPEQVEGRSHCEVPRVLVLTQFQLLEGPVPHDDIRRVR